MTNCKSNMYRFQYAPIEFQLLESTPKNEKVAIVFQHPETSSTEEFTVFLSQLATKIITLNLTQRETNFCFDMCMDLLKNFAETNKNWMANVDESIKFPRDILDLTYELAYQNLSSVRSAHKRTKFFTTNKKFVEPVEKAIGTRWELKKKNWTPDNSHSSFNSMSSSIRFDSEYY